MLLCCFRDSKSDDSPKSGRRHKYRDEKSEKRSTTNQGLTRDSSISRLSNFEESGVILAPITFHPAPTAVESRSSFLPPPYNRSTSVCSNSEQQSHSLSRQSSQQSNSQFGLLRPVSRDGSRRDKERAPLSKEAKRLLKQRSQESFGYQQQHQQHSGENNSQSVSSIPFIDSSPPSAKQAHPDDDKKDIHSVTSTSPLRQFAEEKRRRSHCSTVSTPNLPVTVSPTHQTTTTTTALPSQPQQQQPLSQKTFQSSSTQLSKIEEKIQGRGMCRSSASYGIQQMLQDQISREENDSAKLAMEKEISKVVAACEDKINSVKAEHNLQIQQLLREKTTAINNAKNTFETELQRRTSEIESNLRNQQLSELEKARANHVAEMESLRCQYENAFETADQNHRNSIEHFQERDQAWQTEKQEVLGEIQRLKAEASRFIAILSQEEEYEKSDQQLSPTKKQSLTKEVESLQLVVEMRTAEVRHLKDERSKLLEQLEAFENTRNLLEKMNARVEDLQAQLEAKSQVERQLSLENSKLENCYETEHKNKARMSMQVEELQWRIKHNLELPATQIFSPGSPMSMDESHWTEMTSGPMSMSASQIHSFDEVMMRKQKTTSRTATSTPHKEFYYSNRNTYDVWNKDNSNSGTNGFSLTSPRRCVNKNENEEQVLSPTTPTSVENNNQFCNVITTTNKSCEVITTTNKSCIVTEDREKRDRSTEKQTDDEKVLVIAADSLENLRSNDVEAIVDLKHVDEVIIDQDLAAEDDEGLGDINHGSEASSSPQPPAINNNSNIHHNNNMNNNNNNNNQSLDRFDVVVKHVSDVVVDFKKTSPLKTSPMKMSLSSPCDERVPSRIPFSLQTNL